MLDIFQKVSVHFEKQFPFVLFCKPNSDKIIGLFQNNDELYTIENFEEKGFVFAPFNGDKISFIPQNESDVYVEKVLISDYYFTNTKHFATSETAKIDFENLVKKGVLAIQSGVFKKVVLSRKEIIETDNFDCETVFKKLLSNYPTAFNYCFFHPKIGLWLGATPEQFLKVNEGEIKTVALAGTQIFNGTENVVWETKEKAEQQFVTDFITNSLKDYTSEVTVSEPYTAKAGNILHIKTDITAKLRDKKDLKNVIQTLHPTPAVCGLPKTTSEAFIIDNEGYNRDYYSGFLGELNLDLATFRTEQSDLFVNLRCMKIIGNFAELFIGCGITSDSNPEKEFLETVNKSITMKKVL
jgi:isochorismate synthase